MPPRRAPESAAVRFFSTPAAWRRWLERNHDGAPELWVGFYKTKSGKPSITWPQAVDQALCFGWIDGIRKSIDDASYRIRFTPRKAKSNWSSVNLARVAELTKLGLMHRRGLEAFAARDAERSGTYSYEQRKTVKLPADFEERLRSNAKAWAFFESMAPWYRRTATFWVVSAKQEATRLRRLETLISDSAAGRTIGPLTRPR